MSSYRETNRLKEISYKKLGTKYIVQHTSLFDENVNAFFFVFQYQRGLKNFKAEQPHQHALYYTSFLMEEVCWHKNELLEALDGK